MIRFPGRALCLATAIGTIGSPASAQEDSVTTSSSSWGSGIGEGRSVMVLAPGDTIAITAAGSGPAIIVVPGLLGAAYGFRHVIPALVASGHRVIVVEPLGTGSSARPEHADYTLEGQALRVLHVMNAAGIRSATLLCHSVGGSICYRLALRSPDRVTGIVAINGGPDEHAATTGLRRALKFAPLIRLIGSNAMRGRLVDGLKETSADPAWVTDDVVAAYTAPFTDLGRALRGLQGMAHAEEPEPLGPRLDRLAVPVMLLMGTGSVEETMSAGVLELLEANIPNLTIRRVDTAGQYIHEESPRAVINAVTELRRLAAERPRG
jgi:pimeloyl-ACP methyl ester carboxylesterase